MAQVGVRKLKVRLDAIHLASFELLLERAGDDEVTFSTADDNLARAARRLARRGLAFDVSRES